MDWKTMLGYVSGSVDEKLLLRNGYLVAENRVLRNQIQGRLRLTDAKRPGATVLSPFVFLDTTGWRSRIRSGGITRIRGALLNLGHTVARSTIANILREHGIEPAPERSERTPWRTFLAAHWETVAATDFFTVEVATVRRLVTYYVLVVIELSSRKVHIAGITPGPDGPFMMRVGRNLTDPFDGFLRGKRFLILDRDRKFTTEFRDLLEHAGTDVIRLPHCSPNLNAYVERFVLSIKSECLERMIFFSEPSLRRAVTEFIHHYHGERNHQGLGNSLLEAEECVGSPHGKVRCRKGLGGLLSYYHRAAA